jgi:hypothetical protein
MAKASIALQVTAAKNRLEAMLVDGMVDSFEVDKKKTYSTKLRNELGDVIKALKGIRVEILAIRKKM